MFLPLKDINPTRRRPVVTYTLIAANVAVFIYQISLGSRLGNAFVASYGAVPFEITRMTDLVGQVKAGLPLLHFPGPHPIFLTLLTSMFLHGGLAHLGGNMLFLWIFGNNVEDILGPVRFVFFYLACGLAAHALHIASNPSSMVPTIGASGADLGGPRSLPRRVPPGARSHPRLSRLLHQDGVAARVRHHHLLVRHPVRLRARLPRRNGPGRRGVVRTRRGISRRHSAHPRDGGKQALLAPAGRLARLTAGTASSERRAQSGAGMPSRPSADASRCDVSPKDLRRGLKSRTTVVMDAFGREKLQRSSTCIPRICVR